MSKAGKRGKSAQGGGGAAKWETALLTAVIEEEKWKPNITFVVGKKADDYTWINILGETIAAGSRRLFSAFSKKALYAEVMELGNPKGKKPKETPAHYEICEPCKNHLDLGEEIPLHLLAKLIKFKLLAIKQNDLKRREAEKKLAAEREKARAKAAEKAGGGGGGGKERAKSPGKGKGGGKKTPEPQTAKEGSKLRKRGEEDPDGKYIDDEPDDGADHYIIIYGFHFPNLYGLMSELGMNVNNIIAVNSQDYDRFTQKQTDEQPLEKDEKTLASIPPPSILSTKSSMLSAQTRTTLGTSTFSLNEHAAEEVAREEKAELSRELRAFWRDLPSVLLRQARLHDITRKDYEVKNLIVPQNMEDQEQKALFGGSVFEDIACMIYDLIDAKRKWQNYLNNLKLVQVPVFGLPQSTSPPGAEGDKSGPVSGAPTPAGQPAGSVTSLNLGEQLEPPQVDMRYYTDLMNCVPQESVSVPLIMHCMLEQVEATQQSLDPPSEQQPPKRSDGLHNDLAKHLSSLAFKLALTEEEHNALSSVLTLPERPPEEFKQPLLMNPHDDITIRTHHLKPMHGFDPEKTEEEMLKRLKMATTMHFPRPTSSVARDRAARLQELIHFCATDGMSKSEIDRAFKQFVFESMDLATTDANGFIITRDSEGLEHSAIPWDDPYPFFKGMIPKHEKESVRMSPVSDERSGAESDLFHSVGSDTPISSVSTPSTPPPAPRPDPPPQSKTPGKKKRPGSGGRKSPDSGGSGKKKGGKSKEKKGKRAASPGLDEDKKAPSPEGKDDSRPSSAGSHKGILRPPSRSSSREGRRSRSPSVHFADMEDLPSVHFEADTEGHTIAHVKDDEKGEEEEILGEKSMEDTMNEIVDAQKRQLDQWCFAEHYDKKVLLQVMKEAMYKLPYIDTYYHKRDHSLMVVLHNPHNPEFQNHEDWHTELHSNIGFRNFLDYVEEGIGDWLKEEEAKYQAHILSQEIEKMRQDEETASKLAEKAAKKGKRSSASRSKSPKGSRASSQERPSSTGSNMFIRDGSLKAWKIEQDKLKSEEDEKERVRSAKRAKSPKAKKEEKEEKKRPGSRGSAKSKGSNKEPEPEPAQPEGDPFGDEQYWPFHGYDMGNNLIHVSGITSTLFPSDGGQIRTEKTEYTQGTVSVCTTVIKDDHTFSVHILDPRDPNAEDADLETSQNEGDGVVNSDRSGAEKAEFEKPEKEQKDGSVTSEKHSKSGSIKSSLAKNKSVSAFGSITTQFNDGMTLAFSQFGDEGESADGKKYEPEPYVPPVTDPSPVPPPSPSKGKKEKKGDKGAVTPEPPPQAQDETGTESKAETEDKEEVKSLEPNIDQPFQQLHISCPDGLNIKYMLESHIGMRPLAEDDRRLLVRQSYPYKTNGNQACEAARKKYALSEVSRVITSEGTVIKNMVDGSIQVMYADGTVSEHTGHWELPHSRDSSPQRLNSAKSQPDTPTKDKKGDKSDRSKKGGKAQAEVVEEGSVETQRQSTWTMTYPSGERVRYSTGAEPEELKPVMICQASDPETSQSMATRDDHVMTISYPDGTTILEHADGTRITTYYRETQMPVNDSVTDDEEKEFDIQTNKFVKVECPGFATVEFNCMTSENLTIFGNGTTVNIFPDGYYMLHHYDGGRLEVDTEGTLTYFPRQVKNMEQLLPEREIRYMFCHNADVIVETVDSDGNVFNVKNNGDFSVIPANADDISDVSSEDQMRDKKVHVFKEHAPRFFIIHADGSGTELMRYQDIAEYLTSSEQSPATAVLRDELPDFPGVVGITILKPYVGGPSERWLKKYDQESIIPPGIRCRDLATLPPKEFKTPGPGFGTSAGKGLSVGSITKPQPRIPIVKCPTMLELRQLIQYKPMNDNLRDVMQKGLREYAEYTKQRNEWESYMKVVDPRSDGEKIVAADLQALARSNNELASYEKVMLGSPMTECIRYFNENASNPADVRGMYEKALTPPEPSPPPTPQPRRTQADWERDEREVREEKEGLDAIKRKNIPRYFESEFGKAFLLTQAKDFNETVTLLADDPRRDGTEVIRRDTTESTQSQPEPRSAGAPSRPGAPVTSQSDRSSHSDVTNQPKMPVADTPMSFAVYSEVGHSASGMRPGNPTPAHAAGQGSPAPVRPSAPTPAHGNKGIPGRPGNPTPKQAGAGTESPSDLPSHLDYPIIFEQPALEEEPEFGGEQEMLSQSLKVDVLGRPRNKPVPLPAVIKGGKPGAIPNTRYIQVEDPVRRRTNNSLIAGATIKGQAQLHAMRGLILLPEEVDFGVLREGNTYGFTVLLKNTGVDTCRYKVKQPPPATGIRINFKPGPVAAGMKAEVDVEIYAIAVGVEGESGVGSIRHELEIVTETDVIFLPITATVLTAHEYDNRGPNSVKGGKSPGARLISTKPPSNTGIIRPRKNITLEPVPPIK